MTMPTTTPTPVNTPSSAADWYAVAYRGVSPERIAAEHGGPETQKGGAHAPVKVLNPGIPDGTRFATGCACGHRPRNWPTSPRSTEAAYKAHIRSLGLPKIWNVSHSIYAIGEGYAAEGLTWNEWYALNPGKDPITGK